MANEVRGAELALTNAISYPTSANVIVVLLILFNPERLNIFSKNYRLSTRRNAFLYVVTPNISC